MSSFASGNELDPIQFLRIYSPVLIVIVLSTLQVAFILATRKLQQLKKKRKNTVFIQPEQWYSESIWDDVICAIGSGAILYSFCYAGYSLISWLLLMPIIFLASTTTIYHALNFVISRKP